MKKISCAVGLIALTLLPPVYADGGFQTLTEMSPIPETYVAFKAAERRQLSRAADAAPALVAAEAEARRLWPQLRDLDLIELSRFHVDQTRGFELPEQPTFTSRVLGRDEAGHLHVDIQGPRLPARYDIVHRHLHLLAVVRADGAVEDVTVTIRMRIYE